MRCGSIKPLAIDNEMPVFANLNGFVAKSNQALDVKLVRRNIPTTRDMPAVRWNSFCFKNHNVPTFSGSEIISYAIHEQMITGADLKSDHLLAFVEYLCR